VNPFASHRILRFLTATGCRQVLLSTLLAVSCLAAGPAIPEIRPGLGYTNEVIPRGPWSIHVVRVPRDLPGIALLSVHADRGATGLATVSEQVADIPETQGVPLAAVNGDFYQRDRTFAGDPRGLQILHGELVSAPNGGVAFWVNSKGQPAIGPVASKLAVTWPDRSTSPLLLNKERQFDELVLYTPAVTASIRHMGGRDWILEAPEASNAPPRAAAGTTRSLRIREVRTLGTAQVPTNAWVLSAGPLWLRKNPAATNLTAGASVSISLATEPSVENAVEAIGGGPVLVRDGRPQKVNPPRNDSYEFASMLQRHPRSAVGWNRTHWFFFEVDGRQPGLSVGMTLDELSALAARWGCEEAMTLDGGGSATLWCAGRVRNSPCDGSERPVANALVLVQRRESGKR